MNLEKREAKRAWYVVYTRSRAEKKVFEELSIKNIECFLPLQKKLRQWKDRKKWIETPLISGYCFVRINRFEYNQVLQTNNVVCYVTFEGKAALIPDDQINTLRALLKQYDFEVNVTQETFKPGKIVEIIEGVMIGMRGELIEARGKNKFILRLNQINSTVVVEIPANHLSLVPENK